MSLSHLGPVMLVGAGKMGLALARGWLDYTAIILGILFVAALSYATLALSERVVRVIGVNGMNALSKVMGFLILCIGVQFVVNGVLGIAADPVFVRAIRDLVVTP